MSFAQKGEKSGQKWKGGAYALLKVGGGGAWCVTVQNCLEGGKSEKGAQCAGRKKNAGKGFPKKESFSGK